MGDFTNTTGLSGFEKGDKISVHSKDERWWARLLYWIFRQPPPTYVDYYEITNVTGTTITVDGSDDLEI